MASPKFYYSEWKGTFQNKNAIFDFNNELSNTHFWSKMAIFLSKWGKNSIQNFSNYAVLGRNHMFSGFQVIFYRKCQFLYGPNNKWPWTSIFVNHIGWWFWKDKSMKVTILNVAVERGQNKNDLRPKYQKFIRL